MKEVGEDSGYRYTDHATNCSHPYLLPSVINELDSIKFGILAFGNVPKLFDLGCGNGSVGNVLNSLGWEVTGVDTSTDGIEQAQRNHPNLALFEGSAYDDLADRYGRFPAVISLEVVEHIYAPRLYAKTLFNLVDSGGTAIVSTPYHGYWKNLALATTGALDKHFTALWEHGHIKFWSITTLTKLLSDAGFDNIRFNRVGRIPALAKSMIAIARKP
ncbi:class I SAM-dependent methyltransferase [Mesorhizobium sp. M1088]|uniref:class I SAM-dependent methyltransferase n=1 Tax=Mesorhizobium sp. M1088 TaxID=2957056 RepID=UPI003337AABA